LPYRTDFFNTVDIRWGPFRVGHAENRIDLPALRRSLGTINVGIGVMSEAPADQAMHLALLSWPQAQWQSGPETSRLKF
jgi:hypothetical protein